ncbi:hypothetical protein N665_0041s0026 [Sinapis alba]|nr:hypothetical protein N665_0041s0026 [Sinapis alba]
MNAIRDVLKEMNKKFNSLDNRLTPQEKEVKCLKISDPGMSDPDGDDTLSKQDGGGTPSEQDGDDTPSEQDKDGGSKDVSVVDIAKQIQSEHGKGNDDMDETANMCPTAEKLESQMSENDVAKTKKKKTKRKGDGKEVRFSKKAKGYDNRSPIWTRRQKKKEEAKKSGEKKQKEEAAEKRKACAQKKGGEKKYKKTKKGAFICLCSSYR